MVSLSLTVSRQVDGTSWKVHMETSRTLPDSILLLALVEGGLEATPTAGENAGRHLVHENVVRSVRQLPAVDGDVTITLPPGADAAKSRIIALVQERGSLKIDAAAQAPLVRPEGGAVISGRVVDYNGKGLGGVVVQACSGVVCIPCTTDATGAFSIADVAAGTYDIRIGSATTAARVTVEAGVKLILPRPLALGG
jgi:hypothetical protein